MSVCCSHLVNLCVQVCNLLCNAAIPAVSWNNRIKGWPCVSAWTGTLKNPMKCLSLVARHVVATSSSVRLHIYVLSHI